MAVDDSYTKVLLHCDGADASTTITDESGKTWTARNHAQLDTDQYKFGTASLLLDGTDDYIDTPDGDDFTVGSGDFTFDFWIKRASTGGRQGLFGQCNSSGGYGSVLAEFNTSNQLKVYAYYNAGANAITHTGATYTDTSAWHHIAVIRYSNYLYTAIDGTLSAGTSCNVTVDNVANNFVIGRMGDYAGAYFNGWIDELRFSKGIARWTSNFTPPSAAYAPPSSGFIPRVIMF